MIVRTEFTSDRLYEFLENLTKLFSEYSFVAIFYLGKKIYSPKIIHYMKTEGAEIKDSTLDVGNPESISFCYTDLSELIAAVKQHQEQLYISDETVYCNHSFSVQIFQPNEKILILFRNNFEYSANWLFDVCYFEYEKDEGSLIMEANDLLTHSQNKALNFLVINNLDMFLD